MPAETVDMDDRSLFEAAMAPDAPPPPDPNAIPDVPPPPEAPAASPPGQPRDAFGRWTTPGPAPAEPGPSEAPAGEPVSPDMVPSWRLREEREAREAYASRLAERDAQLTQALNYLRSLQAQAPQQAPQLPDPMLDPTGFGQSLHARYDQAIAQIRAEFANQQRTDRLENNLQLTRMEVGPEEFEAAYEAFMQAGSSDQRFAQSIVGSPNPGASMINWYRNALALQRIGPDPDAFLRQHEDNLLRDRAFLQRAHEALKQAAANPALLGPVPVPPQSFQQRSAATPSNVVVLPPSLQNIRGGTAAEGGSVGINPMDDPMSDQALFSQALRPAPNRR